MLTFFNHRCHFSSLFTRIVYETLGRTKPAQEYIDRGRLGQPAEMRYTAPYEQETDMRWIAQLAIFRSAHERMNYLHGKQG